MASALAPFHLRGGGIKDYAFQHWSWQRHLQSGEGDFAAVSAPTQNYNVSSNNVIIWVIVGIMACVVCIFAGMGYRENSQYGGDAQNSRKKKTRTQKYIKERVILKRVVKRRGAGDAAGRPKSGGRKAASASKGDIALDRKPLGEKSDLVLCFDTDEEEETEETVVCPICLCAYQDGEEICWSKNPACPHAFHSACGIAWLAKGKSTECPVCRAEYLESPADDTTTEPSLESTTRRTQAQEVLGSLSLEESSSDSETSSSEGGQSIPPVQQHGTPPSSEAALDEHAQRKR